jgi:hypothetical protein
MPTTLVSAYDTGNEITEPELVLIKDGQTSKYGYIPSYYCDEDGNVIAADERLEDDEALRR